MPYSDFSNYYDFYKYLTTNDKCIKTNDLIVTNKIDNEIAFTVPTLQITVKDPYKISRIIQNGPATIVFFEDGKKIVVKQSDDTEYNLYDAVSAAIAIKVYGTNSAFKRAIERHTDEYLNAQAAKEKEEKKKRNMAANKKKAGKKK